MISGRLLKDYSFHFGKAKSCQVGMIVLPFSFNYTFLAQVGLKKCNFWHRRQRSRDFLEGYILWKVNKMHGTREMVYYFKYYITWHRCDSLWAKQACFLVAWERNWIRWSNQWSPPIGISLSFCLHAFYRTLWQNIQFFFKGSRLIYVTPAPGGGQESVTCVTFPSV